MWPAVLRAVWEQAVAQFEGDELSSRIYCAWMDGMIIRLDYISNLVVVGF